MSDGQFSVLFQPEGTTDQEIEDKSKCIELVTVGVAYIQISKGVFWKTNI